MLYTCKNQPDNRDKTTDCGSKEDNSDSNENNSDAEPGKDPHKKKRTT